MKRLFFISFCFAALLLASCAQSNDSVSTKKLTEIEKLFPCEPDPENILKQSLSGDIPGMTNEQCRCVQQAVVMDMTNPSFVEFYQKDFEEAKEFAGDMGDESTLFLRRGVTLQALQKMETPTVVNKKCDLDYDDLGDMSPY